jgi:glycosyltransferase involved in cell wall biosynthesis
MVARQLTEPSAITTVHAAADAAPAASPRILIAANFLSADGGSRSVVEDLSERLSARGYKVITTSRFRNGWLRGVHMLGVAITRWRSYDLAVIDLYSGRAFIIGEVLSMALKALRRPFVFVLRGGALPEYSARHPRRVKACLERAALVVAPSPYLLGEMPSFAQTHFAQMQLIPNALDLTSYELRIRKSAKPRLIWLRSFHEIYNPALAPKAVALLVKEFPDIHLTMIGRDKGDGSLGHTRAIASSLGVADRIDFVDGVPKSQVPMWLSRGDIFLNTTNVDNTPVSVLEAFACGLCVVSTNVGGVPYLLEHEQDALLVQRDDPKAMASAVRRLLLEPALAERLSRAGHEKAERFDWSLIMPQWESLFSMLTCHSRGKPT